MKKEKEVIAFSLINLDKSTKVFIKDGIMKRYFLLFLSVLFLFSLNLVSAKEELKKEIQILTMQLQPMFNDYFNALIAKYEKEHPDIKIKWLDYPAQNYETKIMSMFMSKKSPDIINLNPDMGANFVLRNYLLNLDQYVDSNVKAEYYENIIGDGCTYNNFFYALPWYLAGGLTMYNTDIFIKAGLDPNKPPRTWEEVAQYSKIIKEKTGKFGFLPTMTEVGALKSFLYADGVKLLSDDGKKAIFNTEEGYKTIEFWTKVYKDGLIPNESLTANHRRPIEMYKTGQIALFITGPQFLHQIKNDAPDIYKVTKCAPIVVGKGETYSVVVQNLVISNQTKYPKEAVDFAKFVTNAENQLEFCKIVTIFPSVKKAAEDEYFTKTGTTPEDEARIISAAQLKKSIVEVYPRENQGELNRIMEDAIQKACLGRKTPREALDEAAELWTKTLNKKRK